MTDLPDRLKLALGHAANRLLARRPTFVVLATARSGTAGMARTLNRIGVGCSHEGYFTPEGPRLFNRDRSFRALGDISWMAVPFAGTIKATLLHQVREPTAVVRSLIKIGLFDARFRSRHGRYIAFIERHFTPSDCPVDSAIRWYLDWNLAAEAGTDFRYRIEDLPAALPAILARIGAPASLTLPEVTTDFNTRPPVLGEGWDAGLDEAIRAHPAYPALAEMAARYGYGPPEGPSRSSGPVEARRRG